MGLLACMLARAQGARKVVCVDVNEDRLQFAKAQGFVGIVFNSATQGPAPSSPPPPDQTPAEAILTKSVADRVVEVAGLKNGRI